MVQLTKEEARLLAEATEDYLGLWEILSMVRRDLGIDDPLRSRERTIEIIRMFLDQDLLQPGFPVGSGPQFDAWTSSTEGSIQRIQQAWNGLKDDPFTDDIVWFIATPAGEAWVQENFEDYG